MIITFVTCTCTAPQFTCSSSPPMGTAYGTGTADLSHQVLVKSCSRPDPCGVQAVFFSSFCLSHPEFDGRPGRRGATIDPAPTLPGTRESARRRLGRRRIHPSPRGHVAGLA